MKQIHLTVDRIYNNTAVLLGGDNDELSFNMPLALLPEHTKEGDVLGFHIFTDDNEKQRRINLIADLLNDLRS